MLSPRARPDRLQQHLALHAREPVSADFFLWSDHFLFAPGAGAVDGEEMIPFVDTGLVALDSPGDACDAGDVPPSSSASSVPPG